MTDLIWLLGMEAYSLAVSPISPASTFSGPDCFISGRGDHPVRLEQVARGVQKHDGEAEVQCSGR